MPLGFLRRRKIFFANATMLIVFACMVLMVFVITTYLQVLRSYSPIYAGAALLPGSLLYAFLGGFAAPRLVRRVGAKDVMIGAMATFTAGMLLFTQISLTSNYFTVILPAQLIAVVGSSIASTASSIVGLSAAKPGEEGIASGLINTSRQVGGPIGLAVAVSVIGLVTLGMGVAAPSAEVVTAFRYAFLAAAVFAGVGVATSLSLRGGPKDLPLKP